MRCAILAIGTRGDVEPLVALADGLLAAGTAVRFATHKDFEPIVRAHGFEFFQLSGHPARFYNGAGGNAMQQRLRDARAFRRLFEQYFSVFFERLLRESWDAAKDADAVLAWNGCATGLADRLDVPVWLANPYPPLHLPTAAYRNPYQPSNGVHLGPLGNLWSWRLARPAASMGVPEINRWRREVGLGDIDERGQLRQLRRLPHLLGFSPTILPRPWDWRKSVHVTGTWFLDPPPGYEPPRQLADFLAAGPPPVAFGFSSSGGKHVGPATRATIEALARSGQRGLLIAGLGGMKDAGDLPPHILRIAAAPYAWLLPRVAALIHHGGAGSTAWGLRAGVPCLATPFGYDQMLWGSRIHALGAGPAPIPVEAVTVENMTAAIADLTGNPRRREAAGRAAASIRRENGVAAAVDLILGRRH